VSSKKKEKGRGKKAGLCLGCGKGLRVRDRKCRRCGRPSPLFQPKAATPYLVKGGNVVPLARSVCWNGHTGKRGQRHCTSCGEAFGISKMAHEQIVMKSAGLIPGGYWAGRAARDPDPAQREIMRNMAFKAAGGPAGPAAIARAFGYASLADAALNEPDPSRRAWFQNAYYGSNGGVA
jgi:hypothetical protein